MQQARVERAAVEAGLRIARRRDVVPRAGKGALFGVYVMRATETVGHRACLSVFKDNAGVIAFDETDAHGDFRSIRAA